MESTPPEFAYEDVVRDNVKNLAKVECCGSPYCAVPRNILVTAMVMHLANITAFLSAVLDRLELQYEFELKKL
ncbi:hypothetical protein WISP_21981 [Willisornis vidua]|uniref:Uncharacterized protein n=1 Tax=Willisornis vidua TaxID=1566151 RepID=A0ABQ9DPH1_9PASS|nr:hypothetical protein WISP_21981 [Willisornis vidua]